MALTRPPSAGQTVTYPESDGHPIADNTRQFRWISTIYGGIAALFRDNPDVFVAADLLWYPVEGNPKIRVAPAVLVAFGRPRGDRGSYLQWLEDNMAPHVVFEVLSPGNTASELLRKLAFYERYGVEEYYLYDPDGNELFGWQRTAGHLAPIEALSGWVSPRLGVRFVPGEQELELYGPAGQRFATYEEVVEQREQAQQLAEQERQQREQAQQLAAQERQQREQAQQLAEQERQQREQAQQLAAQAQVQAAQLAARLRALGINPDE